MSAEAPLVILNVDDVEGARYAKSRILRAGGYDVIDAGTGEDALRLALERRPALVLLDVHLPDIDGRDVCARIKAEPRLARTLVLQTSASYVESSHRVASLDAGADAYLVEPMEPEELLANVRALLRLRRAEDEREAAMAALKEADRRKDEFLAMLGHELRNPLGPIRHAVEILGASEDATVRDRARRIIDRQARHLARIVDDLLDVSRITQRKVELRFGVASLTSIIEPAVDVAMPMIESHGQRFELSMPPAEVWLEVDAVRLSQVVANLLHNAIKFTPAGGLIRLEASCDAEGLRIMVSDEGIGIAPDMLARVFELFLQADPSLDRAEGGLGIGLSLVKGLVEMHGGSVRAESEGVGRGSRFVVRFPATCLRDAPASAELEARPALPGMALADNEAVRDRPRA